MAGFESSARAFTYTLESAADRSEEGSALVPDGNRMERFHMEHRSDRAPRRPEDDCVRHGLELLGLTLGDAPC